jgi:hypothetical protein
MASKRVAAARTDPGPVEGVADVLQLALCVRVAQRAALPGEVAATRCYSQLDGGSVVSGIRPR